MSSRTKRPESEVEATVFRWPWFATACALHGLLVLFLAYGSEFSAAVPKLMRGISLGAVVSLHWLWLGWVFTGAWRIDARPADAKLVFGIGLAAWIASCYSMLFCTLLLFMHT